MKFAYQFSNLMGTVYRKGDLKFSPDGNSVISPVGNRISVFDLKNNKASTLSVESRSNYTTLEISPDGNILLAVNEDGEAHLISMLCRRIIHKYNFKTRVAAIKFSPDGKYFAACKENAVEVFLAPTPGVFSAFTQCRVFLGAVDQTTCLSWSADSKMLAVGSKDTVTRIYSIKRYVNFNRYQLGSHKFAIIGVFFEKETLDFISVSENAVVCVWECSHDPDQLITWEEFDAKHPQRGKTPRKIFADAADSDEDDSVVPRKQVVTETTASGLPEDETSPADAEAVVERLSYKRVNMCSLSQPGGGRGKYGGRRGKKEKGDAGSANATSVAYHAQTRILVTGLANGFFFVHEMPGINLIHTLSISNQEITSVALNCTGDWIALACAGLGQLLVWEWQSETYVMKQQGHFNNMCTIAYSGDGQYIVTGGEDGKVKMWNTTSGFCYVTFSEHTAPIADVAFSNNRKFVLSASLDGTVRAFDLARYRNFRTFTSPRPAQFSCVAIDSVDELVAAGSQDIFEIYLWSMKIGHLVEVLTGHTAPISRLAFSPSVTSSAMASVSWDGTMRLWDAVESGATHETVSLSADGLSLAWSPDGTTVAVATLDGRITFFDKTTLGEVGSIDGRNDLGSGRSETDLITAKKSLEGKAFLTLCYSADGKTILAGGQSKNVCIYNVQQTIIVKKIEITQNRSFDAVDDMYNKRKMTKWGHVGLVAAREEGIALPGVLRGDMASRAFKPEVRVFSLKFSPTGQAWAAATTEGLLVYALDVSMTFDPFGLTTSVTPASIRAALAAGENTLALVSAVKLNEAEIIQEVVETIPLAEAELALSSLPQTYVGRVLRFVASGLESTRHLDLYLRWARWLLTQHGARLAPSQVMPTLLLLQKNLVTKHDTLANICDFNKYTIEFLLRVGNLRKKHLKNPSPKALAGKEGTLLVEGEEGEGRPLQQPQEDEEEAEEEAMEEDFHSLEEEEDMLSYC